MSSKVHAFDLQAWAFRAFGAFWVLEASMNALFGFRRGGGWDNLLPSLGYAAVFVAVAFVAAWLPTRFVAVRGQSRLDWAKRAGYAVPIAACFVLSQVAGWAVTGVTLADGQLMRDTKADATQSLRDELGRKRAMLANLGSLPAPDQIEAAIARELGTVLRKSSETVATVSRGCAEPAAAPTICKKVAVLREQLAAARNADKLPGEIATLNAKIDKAPKLATGAPDRAILARITTASEEDVAFWFPVFIVLVVGFFANFGFALAGVGAGGTNAAPAGGDPSMPPSWPALPSPPAGPPPGWGAWQPYGPMPTQPSIVYGGSPAEAAQPVATHQGIHIYNNGGGPAGAPQQGEQTVIPPSASVSRMRPREVTASSAGKPRLLPSPAAPRRPVDRGPANEHLDRLLVFKGACLVDTLSAVVPGDDMYACYEKWACGRAMARAAFDTMLPMIGVRQVTFGGQVHYVDVKLRQAAAVAAPAVAASAG